MILVCEKMYKSKEAYLNSSPIDCNFFFLLFKSRTQYQHNQQSIYISFLSFKPRSVPIFFKNKKCWLSWFSFYNRFFPFPFFVILLNPFKRSLGKFMWFKFNLIHWFIDWSIVRSVFELSSPPQHPYSKLMIKASIPRYTSSITRQQ